MALELIGIISIIERVLVWILWVLVVILGCLCLGLIITGFGQDVQDNEKIRIRTTNNFDPDYDDENDSGFTTISSTQRESRTDTTTPTFVITLLIILVALTVFYHWLANKLRDGVQNRDPIKIREWFNIHIALLVIASLGMILRILMSPRVVGGLNFSITCIQTIYRVWSLYVARGFLKKLREEGADYGLAASAPLTEVKWATDNQMVP